MKFKVLTSNAKLDLAIKQHKAHFAERSYDRFVDQAIEEMAELTKILIKERRGRKVEEDIKQEIADVIITIECIIREKNITLSESEKGITTKLDKWLKRISQGKE
jgi:NTP pyrophosphatase (non-canonical NTP hydrolase)